jgi:ribosome-binding factor A
MAGGRRSGRQRGGGRGRRANPAAANRSARVGELIKRIIAEEIELLDDERLALVSITGVDVDRELHRAVLWFTALEGDDDPAIEEAFDEHRSRLRRAVSAQARLRHTPQLEFRADETLRAAERIESLLQSDDRPPVPDFEGDEPGSGDADT